MADENVENPAVEPGVTATPAEPGASSSPAPVISATAAHDEFDPLSWIVPVICKDCGKGFELPYRHFQAGVVFHCPHCHGSFVPNLPMYRAVRDAFETFYAGRKRELEEFERADGDAADFSRKQAAELEEFRKSLDRLAQAMRPAGKMVRRKGLAAMFT